MSDDKKTLAGHQMKLSDGGIVWMSDEEITLKCGNKARVVRFKNNHGDETRLALSSNALHALQLLHDPVPTKRVVNFLDRAILMFEFQLKDGEENWKQVGIPDDGEKP